MSDINLKISDYSIEDLERFLKLKTKSLYSSNDVENKIVQIRELLLQTGHISKYFKRDFIDFLQKAKERLLENNKNKPKPHTTIPILPKTGSDISLPNQVSQVITRNDEIINKEITSFSYVQTSDYFPGTLNPLNIRSLNKFISIDSRFRENITNVSLSNFHFKLPNKIKKVVSLQCSSFEIPLNSIQNISSSLYNNFITIYINNDTHHIAIPDGNYNIYTIIDTLNKTIANDVTGISFSYEETLNRVSLNYTNSQYVKIDLRTNYLGIIDPNNYYTPMACLLGFKGLILSGTNSVIMANNPPNLFLSIPYFYLCVNDFQNKHSPSFEPTTSLFDTNPSIIARMKILPDNSNNTFYEKIELLSTPRQYFGPVDIDKFHVSLLDPYGKIASLNRSEFSFCLKVTVLYNL